MVIFNVYLHWLISGKLLKIKFYQVVLYLGLTICLRLSSSGELLG